MSLAFVNYPQTLEIERKAMTDEEINKRFDHHPPTGEKIKMHENTRTVYKGLARVVNQLPESREKSVALTALEESMFWTNAAIARNPIP